VDFSLNLTAAEVVLVGKALEELPYKLAAPLIDTINVQLQAQQSAAEPPKPPKPPKA